MGDRVAVTDFISRNVAEWCSQVERTHQRIDEWRRDSEEMVRRSKKEEGQRYSESFIDDFRAALGSLRVVSREALSIRKAYPDLVDEKIVSYEAVNTLLALMKHVDRQTEKQILDVLDVLFELRPSVIDFDKLDNLPKRRPYPMHIKRWTVLARGKDSGRVVELRKFSHAA